MLFHMPCYIRFMQRFGAKKDVSAADIRGHGSIVSMSPHILCVERPSAIDGPRIMSVLKTNLGAPECSRCACVSYRA